MPKRRTAFYTARVAANLTQVELARASGVTQSAISELEIGRNRNPSWDVLSRVAQVLGVRPDQLMPPARLPRRKPVETRIIADPLYRTEANA